MVSLKVVVALLVVVVVAAEAARHKKGGKVQAERKAVRSSKRQGESGEIITQNNFLPDSLLERYTVAYPT